MERLRLDSAEFSSGRKKKCEDERIWAIQEKSTDDTKR